MTNGKIGTHKLILLLHAIIFGFALVTHHLDLKSFLFCALVILFLNGTFANYALHLRLSHKKYLDTLTDKILSLCAVAFVSISSPLSVVINHRMHHLYVDSELDPHAPSIIGWKNVVTLNWRKTKINKRSCLDILKSSFQQKLHRHFMLIHFLFILLGLVFYKNFILFIVSPCILYTTTLNVLINWRGHLRGVPRDVYEIMLIAPFSWRHRAHHLAKEQYE